MKMSMHEKRERSDKKREKAMRNIVSVPAGTPTTPLERGFAECPCPKKCTLHGDCLPCVAYHLRKHAWPRCQR
jgi:hypothetical protein